MSHQGSHLSTLAHDKVASAVLLHRLCALGARLGIGKHPISGLAVTGDLLVPVVPPEKSIRFVGELLLFALCHFVFCLQQ